MRTSYRMVCLIGAFGLMLFSGSGCSKSIDAGSGSKEFEQGKQDQSSKEQQARGSSEEPLKGFESVGSGKEPKEERLGGGGTMVAKADSTDAAQRAEEQRAAGTATGLIDVFFGYDSWKIPDEGKNALARDAEWLKANPKEKLVVEGHCDERGTQAYNLVLGEKRAKSVRGYLTELGIAGDRLAVRSYGKEKPFCKEQDESCYQQNRRAHVVLRAK
jgi:peptidoglycan-associated lipoprotein